MPHYKIAIIGEAFGEEEEQWNLPFVGSAGKQLNSILEDAGIVRSECLVTNVFMFRPNGNDLSTLCVAKTEPDAVRERGTLVPGKHLSRQYEGELVRLYNELEQERPNLAILLGNCATWALLDTQAISKIRGTCRYSTRLSWLKCLPTFHPAAVLRQYDLRHVTVLDFIKAKREAEFPEVRRPRREVWVEPDLRDISEFKARYLDNAERIAFDIETDRGEQITCISFAATIDRALCIPFQDSRRGGNYWPDLETELDAWELVAAILNLPAEKMGQNVLYDVQYLWMKYHIPVRNLAHDSMLLHHSLQPESEKGLGFLGSVYTNEASWKADRPRGRDDFKREE